MSELGYFIEKTIVWILIVALFVLIITSLIVRDYKFIFDYPLNFTFELICLAILPAFLLSVVFVKSRKLYITDSIAWFIVVSLKFSAFHVLLQLSGVYTVLFGI